MFFIKLELLLCTLNYILFFFRSYSGELHCKLMDVLTNSPLDIQLIMHRCLYPHIIKKCNRASGHLVELLKTEYYLLDYLAAMRVSIGNQMGEMFGNSTLSTYPCLAM